MWTGRRTTTSFANHGLLMKHALSKGISRNLVHPTLMEKEMTPAALKGLYDGIDLPLSPESSPFSAIHLDYLSPVVPANEQRQQHVADLYKIAYEGITTERFHPNLGCNGSWCQYRREYSWWFWR